MRIPARIEIYCGNQLTMIRHPSASQPTPLELALFNVTHQDLSHYSTCLTHTRSHIPATNFRMLRELY